MIIAIGIKHFVRSLQLQSIIKLVVCITMFVLMQIRRWSDSGGRESFRAADYMAVTPDWAQFGHPQQGFDPEEVRWHRKNKKKDMGGC